MGVTISNHSEHVRILRIDRPPVNALDNPTMEAFGEAVDTAMQDSSVRVIVVTGAGEKAFAAGADLDELAVCDPEGGKKLVSGVKTIMGKLRQGTKPVIAAINGLAAGGGLELAMSCDIRVADGRAGLGLPEVTLGVLPGSGGTQMLPRLIGVGRALDMMLSGKIISAEEGFRLGLIDLVAGEAGALADALAMAEKLSANAPLAMAEIKALAYATLSQPLAQGFEMETDGFGRLCETQDRDEGIAAFKSRRKAVFQGK
ncbi:enoyl-CoA hydratase/isomerase family protein [Desulfosarcina ovata]|uniref:3-hydroxybutyryl-CoA dehydratase n=1 Tax=Desulfosarcina ovata subsp. ovata TaxID=2752305 RepID=A0A5K8ANJ5_9BACT|nr:enoyl-CoA hydratase-related protein [Desulfosarcina ovata]BBO93440.1 3-hydroxybutyryl-CoA dehydratase [Desulfosarcina ovata subsp. ovata]